MKAVGQNIPHDSAVGHVTGEALYVDDLPPTQGEVLVDAIASPIAHGKLLGNNFDELRELPGIVGLYTVSDLPGHNRFGVIIPDECFLPEDVVEYVGQPIAVVAAENRRALRKAKQLAKLEIEELPPVFTIEEAIAARQFIGPTRTIQCGDFEAAWNEAEHRLEGVFHCNGQEQFYLESQAA
ncbi:MAG: molybdopterin-dependent oxidoreductase, partial [SAR324 cluster bacterium]|nr:molybdopterin-dependent oxidoreductase [SAR324 cluster bacterium]